MILSLLIVSCSFFSPKSSTLPLVKRKNIVFNTWPSEYASRLAINQAMNLLEEGESVLLIDTSPLTFAIYGTLHKSYLYNSHRLTMLLRYLFRKESFYINSRKIKKLLRKNNQSITTQIWYPRLKFSRKRIFSCSERYEILAALWFDARGSTFSKSSIFARLVLKYKFFLLEQSLLHYVSKLNVSERWFIFNGRFPIDRILAKIASQSNIIKYFYEVSMNGKSLSVYAESPHSYTEHRNKALQFWFKSDSQLREREAEDYLNGRLHKLDESIRFWTVNQEAGLIRSFPKKKIYSFFLSTEGELASLKSFNQTSLFNNQWEALNFLISELDFSRIHLVVRGHPHFASTSSSDPFLSKGFDQFMKRGLISYIKANDSDDSIALLTISELVFVFDSSIGIDAISLEKPLVIFGAPFFSSVLDNKNQNVKQIDLNEPSNFLYDRKSIHPWAFYCKKYGKPLII